MNSIQQLSSIYVISIWIVIALLLIIGIYRFIKFYVLSKPRFALHKVEGSIYAKVIKVCFTMCMMIMLICLPFYCYIGSGFRSIIPSFLNNALLAVSLLICIQECLNGFTLSEKLKQKTYKKVVLTIILVPLSVMSFDLIFNLSDMFKYPSVENCYIFELPINGRWTAGHAGGTVLVNYHCAVPAQMYAMDIMKINDEGRIYTGSGSQISEFPTMKQPILSPIDGVVVGIKDGLSNAPISLAPFDTINPAGNHVVIEFEKERYVFLAHMDSGSVSVKVGDRVVAGQEVGLAGNSGNTTYPHLHMHIQDKPVINNREARGYPYRFKRMKRTRMLMTQNVENDYLLRDDVFEPIK